MLVLAATGWSDAPAAKPLESSAHVHKIPTALPPDAQPWPENASVEFQPETLSDEQVSRAIRRGVDFLIRQYKNGHVVAADSGMSQPWREGLDALSALALLQSSPAIRDERLNVHGAFISNVLEQLNAASMETDISGKWGPVTYARSLRAMALAVYNRPEDRDTLQDDAAWLANAEVQGAYFYDDRFAGGRGRQSDLPDQPPPRESEKPQQPATPPRIVPEPPVTPKPPLITSAKRPMVVIKPRPAWPTRRIVYIPPPRPLPPSPRTPPPRTAPPMPRSNQPPIGVPIDPASLARPLPPEKDPKLRPDEIPWDNSNSQFGVLGVLAAAEAGIEIPDWYWKDIEYHWLRWQMRDGGWSYRATSTASTLAMTCAGVSAMSAIADWLGGGLSGGASAREPFSHSLEAGLHWLAQGENAVAVGAAGSRFISYDLFSLARAGGACGFKYFGDHDWYRELAADVLTRQATDGSWGGDGGAGQGAQDHIIETAYALLFLSRGQHPVLLTKLRFDGPWANHPHDAANLARYVGRALERGVNWQVVDLRAPLDRLARFAGALSGEPAAAQA
jgi:hypothetical protein